MAISINEISVSTTGIDKEFIELTGTAGTDLSGLSILEIASGGEIVDEVQLTGHVGANGYYLITSPEAESFLGVTGNQQIADNTLSNSSRTYLLVEGFSGTVGDDIDLDDNGVIDAIRWSGLLDGVAVIDNDSPTIYSANVVGPDGSFLAPGGYRNPEATGAFVMHAFADFTLYSPTAGQDVVINEIVVSTTGVDAEFMELVGLPGTDLSGVSLLEIEPGGEIDSVISLSGSIGGNGHYLIASPAAVAALGVTGDLAIADNTFSNGSRTYLLVEGFTGASGDDIDADDDGVIDSVAWTTILDSVAPIDNDSPLIYSANVVGPDGAFLAAGGYRDPEGRGDFVMHDFFDFAAYTPTASAPFAINEIVVSTTGVDTEFLEIVGRGNADLAGYSVLEVLPGGQIDTVIALTGQTGENGYYLLASPAAEDELLVVADQQIADNTFSNGSRTYLLVEGFTGASGDDIDADDDGAIDFAPWASITDSVAPIDNDNPLIYSANVVGPDGAFLAAGGYRSPERVGAFVMHDFFDLGGYTPTSGNGGRPLVINEIVVSTTGVDTEFLELIGTPGEDLSAYSILEIEPGGEIDSVIGLTGSIGENGYYLLTSPAAEATLGAIGNQQFADNTFSNGSRTYLLVRDFTGASGDDIDADDDGAIDATFWSEITDSVAPIDNDSPLIYSANVVGPDGAFLAAGGYRDPEGRGDFVMHDFFDLGGYTPTAGTGGGTGGPEEVLISQVQGSTDLSPLAGQTVTVEAIVVGDFQNGDGDALRNLGGFFVMEEAADQDGDAATSEGLFIYDGALALVDVGLGDRVRITGTVSEFQGQTQIGADTITVIEAGAVADVNAMAVSVTLDAIDAVVVDGSGLYAPDMEAYEGMLATFTDTLTVNEMFQMDRFNEIRLSANGRPVQFTQAFDPDPVAYDAYQRAAGSDQIIFDDGLNVQNAAILPEADLNDDGVFDTADGFSMGDTITGLTGIVNYTWAGNAASGNSWRVRSIDDANSFADTGTRETAPPDVGGTLTVASFNVLNFFTTLDVAGNPGSGPLALDPRGADSTEEFDRQLDKLVTTLAAMNADIYGLIELENEFGTDQNGDGLVALNLLVDELNARIGSVTYAAVDVGRGFVDVADAISVGMIYNVTTVSVVPGSVAILDDSVLPTLAGGFSGPIFDGADTNRAPLAATFEDLGSGEEFTVAVTHMKSKGGTGTGADADLGDGAGAFNGMRTEGVQALTEWLAGIADDDLIVLGDFNAYAMEDPVDAMRTAGFTDLAGTLGAGADSYVFDGKTGTLDYAFGSGGIMDNVTGAAAWGINAAEPDAIDYNTDFGRDPAIFDGSVPYRASDHDPVLIGLDFGGGGPILITGTAGNDYLVGTDAAEILDPLGGRIDVLTGGGGADLFDFASSTTNGAREMRTITDFEAGVDTIGLGDAEIASVRSFGGRTYLFLDGDGDVILLEGVAAFDMDNIA